jgi:SNF2 family DNA or RNA helicase
VKYPPYSWLRLSDEIRQSPSRMWFAFNKLPLKNEVCYVRVHIGASTSVSDPFDAVTGNILLPREQKVLEMLLKMAKPTKSKAEFLLDHASFGTILPYFAAIPFEVTGRGVISFAKQNARIKASLVHAHTEEAAILFSLLKASNEPIVNPMFFGEVNAYVIDQDLKLYLITPNVTQAEAESILSSSSLPLLGLCQKESRQMFYALSRMGIDFSCLNEISLVPKKSQIVLRLLLTIDDLSKKMCARAHLVTQITDINFHDEVEIRSTGAIPTIHISATSDMDEQKYIDAKIPNLLRRPANDEKAARHFLYQLGASPARLHDGFELMGDDAFSLLKAISQKGSLPSFIELDEHARPEIIELLNYPSLHIKSDEKKPKRVEVSLKVSDKFDKTDTNFSLLNKAKDNILVLDEDNLVVLNPDVKDSIKYFSETLSIEKPNIYKSKSVAQIALLLNAFKDRINIEAEPELKSYLENFSIEQEASDRDLPKSLKATLRPYQHDAVAWLSSLYRSGLGGLLGDEMGLGKTLMVLTHLARLKEMGESKYPALVVCPTSVIDVWKNEAKNHFDNISVIKWHGISRNLLEEDIKKTDIVITSYAILRRDIGSILKDCRFSTLVIDEAQYVRNQQTDSFKSAKAVNCDHRIALTGTPIENHLTDLFNILDCVEEGILGSRQNFDRQFVNPIEAGNMESAMNLKALISPIVIRRRKAEVESELPPKIESIVHCKLSPEQRALYKQYVNQMKNTFNEKNTSETHFTMLSALTRLRQICCHPSLILGKDAAFDSSGKLNALKDIMKECLEMDRHIIIYSQFLKMQEHIVDVAKELDPKGALWLHGSSTNRDEIVESFQSENGPRIIVVSLKAGGTGITLTKADTVIFADPWWNPAVEDQAVDRAHRIGQKKTVHVIRLIAEDSIEGEVVHLAEKKRQAAHSVLHEGFKTSANLTKDEVRSLLLKEIDRALPSDKSDEADFE